MPRSDHDPDADAPADVATAYRRIVALVEVDAAYTPRPIALGPAPTADLRAALNEIGEPPIIRVRCGSERCIGYHLARWQLDLADGIVKPVHTVTPAHTGRAVPVLDRANAGKGPIEPGRTHDGLGRQTYTCRRCRKATRLRPERRLLLFARAALAGRRDVFI